MRYAGVLAPASKLRPKLVARADDEEDESAPKKASRYWPWAELMARSFEVDVEKCPRCKGRMKLVALVQEKESLARFLERLGEPSAPPVRAPARAPPYYKSAVIRRLTSSDVAVA